MVFRAIRVALLLSILPTAGCGTVANLAQQKPDSGGVRPFGGVKHDLAGLQNTDSGDGSARLHSKSDSETYPPRTAMKIFCAVDLPFSLVGDVLTWPYTAVYSVVNEPVPTPPVVITDPTAAPPLPALPAIPPMPVPNPPKTPPKAEVKPPAPPQPLPKLTKLP